MSIQAACPRLRRVFSAADPRADGLERHISIDSDCVRIARRLRGIDMRIGVPLQAYRGVQLSLEQAQDGGSFFRVRLLHADPDLSVTLDEMRDETRLTAVWRGWSEALGLPALADRGASEAAAERAKGPAPRRASLVRSRRGRFARRRKSGSAERMAVRFGGEREIIARN